jgi:heat shock protein HslJ
MEMRTILARAASGILLLGCESLPEKSPLTENLWEVVTIDGKPVIQTRKPLTTEFLPDGTLHGYNGVNWFTIGYEIHGKRIALHETMRSTLVGMMDPEIGEQESAYMGVIGRMRSFFFGDGDQLLHLCDAKGKELATLKKAPR